MYNPCEKCSCILRKDVCKQFCTAYKAAARERTRKGFVEYGMAMHNRIKRRG